MNIAKILPSLSWMLTAILSTISAHGLSPDPKILSLIPPGAQLLSGSGVSESSRERRKLLIFTQESALDLDNLVALAAVDDSKFIRQIFIVSGRQGPTSPVEHSVLAIGQFDHSRIYKAAIQNGARTHIYRGIEIVQLRPFLRDRRSSDDLLWMAVIGSELALFGTVSNVREELDRYVDHVQPDPTLMQRIAKLRSDDETWGLMPGLEQFEEIRQDLGSLDPRLLDAANNGLQFQFGVHYGRRIQVDYEFAKPAGAAPAAANDQLRERSVRNERKKSFFSGSGNRADPGSVRGVISVSTKQYEEWLAKLDLLGARMTRREPNP